MKKILSTIIMMAFIIGMVPFAFAEDPINDPITSFIATTETVDDCITKVSTKYPRIEKDRIENLCEDFIKNKEEIKEKIETRSEIREEIQANDSEIRAEIRTRIEERIKDDVLRNRIETEIRENLKESDRYKLIKFLEENPNYSEKIKSLSDEEIKKLASFDRDRLKTLVENNNLGENLAKYEIKTVSKEDLYRKRVVAENKYEEAKKQYEKAQERYKKASENFKESKERFEKAVKEGNDEEAITQAQKYIGNGIEMIIASLEKVKENANSNNDLTEEEVEDITSKAEEKITEMTELATRLDSSKTKEEIKEIAAEMSQEWTRAKLHIAVSAAKAYDSKVGEILSRSTQLEAKLERVLLDLEESGYDITELNDKVDEFNEEVESARTNYAAGKQIIEDIRAEQNISKEDFETSMNEAKELIKNAHESLKEAQKIITEIFKEAKKIDKNVSFEDESDEYEVVEEIEDESDEEDEEELDEETEDETESEDEEEIEDETNDDDGEEDSEDDDEESYVDDETETEDLNSTIINETIEG